MFCKSFLRTARTAPQVQVLKALALFTRTPNTRFLLFINDESVVVPMTWVIQLGKRRGVRKADGQKRRQHASQSKVDFLKSEISDPFPSPAPARSLTPSPPNFLFTCQRTYRILAGPSRLNCTHKCPTKSPNGRCGRPGSPPDSPRRRG